MNDIVSKIRQIQDVSAIEGCTDEQIEQAQVQLHLTFPKEYVAYVKTFGCIDFGATEWTGLNIEGRLNTVTATQQEMSVNPNFPIGCFVLQNLGIDAKRIIVNENGEVYLLQYDRKKLICSSISEYLDICLSKE